MGFDSFNFVIQYKHLNVTHTTIMLSVRLPEHLENRLTDYCETMQVSRSFAVQTALEKHLKRQRPATEKNTNVKKNPFLAIVGIGNGQFTTEQVMRMTRGDDWNQP
jgi:hypothetical protein